MYHILYTRENVVRFSEEIGSPRKTINSYILVFNRTKLERFIKII